MACCNCHCSCKKKTEVVLKVNLCCRKCEKKVLKAFNGMSEVDSIDVDCDKQTVTIKGCVTQEDCIKKLKKIGKGAEPCPKKDDKTKDQSKQKEQEPTKPETIVVYKYLEGYPHSYYADSMCYYQDQKPDNCSIM